MKILVCNPDFYDVTYSINPWMRPENGLDSKLATKQWHDLVSLIQSLGVEVIQMSGKENVPDIVFTANAGAFLNNNKVILSKFKHPERQPEEVIYKNWFLDNGYHVLEYDLEFEGAGDILKRCVNGLEFYAGYGFRTNERFYSKYFYSLFPEGVRCQLLKLVDPYFYHLDTCLCPLPGDFALVYRGAFDPASFATLEGIDIELADIMGSPTLLDVPENEARRFACNAVVVNNSVIIPSGCPETKSKLQNAGFDVYDTDMSEYIRAGGACKCLTLKLEEPQ